MATTNEETARSESALTPEQAVRLAVFRAVYDPCLSHQTINAKVTLFTTRILDSLASPPEDTPRTD